MKFSFIEVEKCFPIRFVFCKDNEIILIQKEENMTNLQVNTNIFYYELHVLFT